MADSVKRKVFGLMEKVPAIVEHERGDLLLTLLYWRYCDGIKIPDSLMKQLFQEATPPETITRRKRELLATFRDDADG